MKYRVLIEQDEDGMYVVEVPALPGCLSQGRTRSEALTKYSRGDTSLYRKPREARRTSAFPD